MTTEQYIKQHGLRPTKAIGAPNGNYFIVWGTLHKADYKDDKGDYVMSVWKGDIGPLKMQNIHMNVYAIGSAYVERDINLFIKNNFKKELE